jgi:hypothetical protein
MDTLTFATAGFSVMMNSFCTLAPDSSTERQALAERGEYSFQRHAPLNQIEAVLKAQDALAFQKVRAAAQACLPEKLLDIRVDAAACVGRKRLPWVICVIIIIIVDATVTSTIINISIELTHHLEAHSAQRND